MSNDSSYNNSSSSNNNDLCEPIPETSPAFQFCEKKSEINEPNENGWTPIYRSIISNNIEALKDLLKFGGNPNICNNLGESPIYLCVDMDNLEALNVILNNNPKPNCNIQKRNGDTALHLAIKKNKTKFIIALLDNNADPNIGNKLYSQTPTHLAIINKVDDTILEKLKNNNADIYNLKDKYDKTAYDYAVETNDENYIKSILKIFGDKIQRRLLYNSLSDLNKSSNINNKSSSDISNLNNNEKKNNNILKSIDKNSHTEMYNSKNKNIIDNIDNIDNIDHIDNIYSTDNNHFDTNSGIYDNSNISKKDKQKIKDIIFSEVNKINVSDLSVNNFSTPKENLNFLNINSNINSNSNLLNYDNKLHSFLTNNSKKNNKDNNKNISSFKIENIIESHPIEMINKVIITNESQNKNDKNDLGDSLEFSKGKFGKVKEKKEIKEIKEIKEKKEKYSDSDKMKKKEKYSDSAKMKKKEDITDIETKTTKDHDNKKQISYHNLNRNKEKLNHILNLSNNNNKSNSRNNYNINNNIEINQSNNINKNRKSFGSNYSNIHYDSSTNQNTTRGSNLVNMQFNNIMSSLKNNDIKTNYTNLTEINDDDDNIINSYNNFITNQNKTKESNSNYKTNNNNILTEDDNYNSENISIKSPNKNIISKQIEQNKENIAPINANFSKLRDWLISCDLISYYNLLKNSSFNIEQIIKNIKNNKSTITYREIENLGIRKPGHIFRFLIKLEIDANKIDYDIHSKIINKFNSNILTTVGLTASNNELRCCGMTLTLGNKEYNNYNKNNHYSDIFHFLRYLDLMKFKENFIHNGFDQVDYIILQLFSKYKFDKIILKEFLHIYDENDKKRVINILYEEKKKIARELGIYIDQYEKETILSTQIKEEYDNDKCLIF